MLSDEEKAEEYIKSKNWNWEQNQVMGDEVKRAYLDGLAEGRKEKELSYKVGKVTKAELNKCKTIEEKMEWLGKVLGYAIFKDDMNYAVWVNVQKNNIIDNFEKGNEQLKAQIEQLSNDNHVLKTSFITQQEQIEKMKCCGNCKYLTRKLLNCENIQICKINPNNIYGVCDIWELAE